MEAKPIKSKDARIKNGKWTEAKPIKSKDARMENGNPFGLFCKRRCISSKPSNKNDNLKYRNTSIKRPGRLLNFLNF